MSNHTILEINRIFCNTRGGRGFQNIEKVDGNKTFLYTILGCGFYGLDNFKKVIYFEVLTDNTLDMRQKFLTGSPSRRPFPGNIFLKESDEDVPVNFKNDILNFLSNNK